MMKILRLLMISSAMVLFTTQAQAGDVTGVGGVNFGMSFDKIIKKRGEPDEKTALPYFNILTYEDIVLGKNVKTQYFGTRTSVACKNKNLSKCDFQSGGYNFMTSLSYIGISQKRS